MSVVRCLLIYGYRSVVDEVPASWQAAEPVLAFVEASRHVEHAVAIVYGEELAAVALYLHYAAADSDLDGEGRGAHLPRHGDFGRGHDQQH